MPILSAIAIARRWWPIAAVLTVVLALWAYGRHREGQGVAKERAAWQKVVAVEQAKVRAVEKRWQDEHNKADAADVARIAAQDALMTALQRRITVYGNSETGRACGLDPAGGLLINEAVAAANRTVAASPAPRS